MTTGLQTAALAFSAALATTPAPAAAPQPAPPPLVRIENVAASVIVTPEARADISAEIRQAPGLPPLRVQRVPQGLAVNGGLVASAWDRLLGRRDGAQCASGEGRPAARAAGRLWAVERLPVIRLRVPLSSRIIANGATWGAVASPTSLKLSLTGCGAWTIAPMRGPLVVQNAGSATVLARRVDGRTYVDLGGPGAVTVADGRAVYFEVALHGPGRVVHNGIVSHMNAQLDGAGRIQVRQVTGFVETSENGTGRITYGRPAGVAFCGGYRCSLSVHP
jgi:hypothetical protein